MLIFEIAMMAEDSMTDQTMRDKAAQVIRDITDRAGERLQTGIITFNTNGNGRVPLPVHYMPTMMDNLIVGLAVTGGQDTFLFDMRGKETTIPRQYQFLISFPHGRLNYIPKSVQAAQAVGKRELPEQAWELSGRIIGDRRTFIHEFTHYWDFTQAAQRGRFLPPSDLASRGIDHYANTPLERNAYYNEIIAERPASWFARPFEVVVRDTFAQMEIGKHLTEPNRRRLVSRLYQVWLERNRQSHQGATRSVSRTARIAGEVVQ